MFKKSMRKHIFQNFQFFLYKKNVQNILEYWPYANTHKKNIFFIFSLSNIQTLHLITIKKKHMLIKFLRL